ncbi:MAG: hypothetical protein KGL39_09745 [Patescibacteria group bacterium]|nr:hypothetical protein [Patescibacteria group bacterium]
MSTQTLFDDLAGAAGAPVDRPRLDAFVAQSQMMNGLRSAETNAALLKAQQQMDALRANRELPGALAGAQDASGNPLFTQSESPLLADLMVGNHGNFPQVTQGLGDELVNNFRQTIGNPNADSNARLAAIDAVSGKVQSPFQNVGSQLVSELSPDAATNPQVTQTPVSQADIEQKGAAANASDAKAALDRATAANPTAFGHGFPQLTPQQSATLSKLVEEGLDPERLYAYARDPSLLDAVGKGDAAVPGGVIGLGHSKQAQATAIGSGADAQTIERLSTAANHLSLVPQAIDAVSRGDYPLLNRLFQGLQVQAGAAPPVVAKQLAEFLSNEMQAVIAGTTKGDAAERSTLASYFQPVASMGQLLAATHQAAQLLGGRAQATEQHYVGIMSQGEPASAQAAYRNRIRNMLSPEARALFGMHLIRAPTGAASGPAGAPDIAALARAELARRAGGANGRP